MKTVIEITADDALALVKKYQNQIMANAEACQYITGQHSGGWLALYAINAACKEEHPWNKGLPTFHLTLVDDRPTMLVLRNTDYAHTMSWYNYVAFIEPLQELDQSVLPLGSIPFSDKLDAITPLRKALSGVDSVNVMREDKEPVLPIKNLARLPGGHFARKRSGARRYLRDPRFRIGDINDLPDHDYMRLIEEWDAEKQASLLDNYKFENIWTTEYEVVFNKVKAQRLMDAWPCETVAIFDGDRLIAYAFGLAITKDSWVNFTRIALHEYQYLADFLFMTLAQKIEARGGELLYDMAMGYNSAMDGLVPFKRRYIKYLGGWEQNIYLIGYKMKSRAALILLDKNGVVVPIYLNGALQMFATSDELDDWLQQHGIEMFSACSKPGAHDLELGGVTYEGIRPIMFELPVHTTQHITDPSWHPQESKF